MRKYVVLSVLLGLLTAVALAGAPSVSDREESPRPVRAGPPCPGAKMINTTNPVEALPEVQALRAEQRLAQIRGDEPSARAIENRIQRFYLDRTPPQSTIGHPVAEQLPPGGSPAFVPDIVIQPNSVAGSGTDYEVDGTMWVACSPPDSTVHIWKSMDHGQTWEFFGGFSWSTKCPFSRVQVVVGTGDSNFVHIFTILPFQDGDLIDVIYTHDGTLNGWSALKSGADTVGDFAVCRDNISPYFLHAVAVNTLRGGLGNTTVVRSVDYGRTWAETQYWNDCLYPSISTGASNSVYFTAAYATLASGGLGLLYNRNYGGGTWLEEDIRPDTLQVGGPAAVSAFTVPDSEAVIWWAWHHWNGSTYEVLACYSTDGGANFSTPVPTASLPGRLQSWTDLKNYREIGNAWVNISYFSMESERLVYRQYVNASTPGNWSDTVRINAEEVYRTRDLTPWLVYSPGGPGSGAGCVFMHYNSPSPLCWNSPWATAVAEPVTPRPAAYGVAPSIVRGALVIDDRGRKAGDRSELLDISGRNVMSLRPGANDVSGLAPGVYVLRREAGGAVEQHKVIIQ